MTYSVVMVAPDLRGHGGISRVVSIWRTAGFFDNYNVTYVSTTSEISKHKLLIALKALVRFLIVALNKEIVYIHSAHYNSFYRKSLFVVIAGILGKKLIMHIHPSEFPDFYSGLKGVRRKYASLILKQIHSFVVLTEEMQRYLLDKFPDKNVYILRNAVNIHEMSTNEVIQRRTNELLFLGWYIRAKGVYELVDAVELLTQRGIAVHLNFYGTKDVEQLTDYVLAKGLTEVINVNGWIGGTEKLKALYGSSMLILPSHSEGIPNVILEAMATKTPIVATFVGGMKEILCDRVNAVIAEVSNPVDLSEKILMLLQDDALRNRLAENAYLDAVVKYNVPVIRKYFREIIEGIGR